MNYIFGSGIVGLLAKHILPGNWTVIPFGRSRFFTFNPPIDDDYIIYDERLDDVISRIYPNKQILMRKRAWSLKGQLFPGYDRGCAEDWLNKVFGGSQPGQSHAYLTHHMGFASYDLNLHDLYGCLQKKYAGEIASGNMIGKVESIGDHHFVANGKRYDFENVVSTIPLNALLDYGNIQHDLVAKNAQVIQLFSRSLDFEGNDQVFIADHNIHFYKVSKLSDGSYIFYFNGEMAAPARYLMDVLDDFKILNGTMVEKYIPQGSYDLTKVKQLGFTPIGSYAEWDWCGDVGTNILRLLNLEKYKSI